MLFITEGRKNKGLFNMELDYKLEFRPPDMPFAYTEEQAREIYKYMELYYSMIDVYTVILGKDKKFFREATDTEKNKILACIAEDANEIMHDYGIDYATAIEKAIIDYEENCSASFGI